MKKRKLLVRTAKQLGIMAQTFAIVCAVSGDQSITEDILDQIEDIKYLTQKLEMTAKKRVKNK